MIDLMQATQDAVYAALAAAITDVPVRQHLAQGQQPPFVRIFGLTSESQADKDDQLEEITVEVHVVTQGEQNGPLLTLMHRARSALDGKPLTSSIAVLERPTYASGAADGPADDGITYAGVLTFRITAQPA